jgi:hypothetical protein
MKEQNERWAVVYQVGPCRIRVIDGEWHVIYYDLEKDLVLGTFRNIDDAISLSEKVYEDGLESVRKRIFPQEAFAEDESSDDLRAKLRQMRAACDKARAEGIAEGERRTRESLREKLLDCASRLDSVARSPSFDHELAALRARAERLEAALRVAMEALEWFADEGHYTGTYRHGAGFVDAVGLTKAEEVLAGVRVALDAAANGGG